MIFDPETPDGLSGVLLGLESFLGGVTVLHGPTGCRGPHSALSERMLPRSDHRERMNYQDPFFFGQPRIPTTCLDGNDIVFGGRDKLLGMLRELGGRNTGSLALVNSPGAALIGDDLRACVQEAIPGKTCAVVEWPSLSRRFSEGYQQGILAFLEALELRPLPVRPRTVALLGLSIAHAHWEGSLTELKRLLDLCGLELVCALGAGADQEACRRLASADLLAVVHGDWVDQVVPWLETHLSGRVIHSSEGAPIGFTATETWVRTLTSAAGMDPGPALADLRAERSRMAHLLNQITGSVGHLKGTAFALRLDADMAMPLACWLYSYLGLLPVSIDVPDNSDPLPIPSWLDDIGCPDAWQRPWIQSEADLLLSDGPSAMSARMSGLPSIELSFPVDPVPPFLPTPLLGVRGAVWLVEQIVREVLV